MSWFGVLLLVSCILHVVFIPIIAIIDENRLTNKEMIILFILECIMAPLFVLIGLIFVLIKRWLYGK